MTFSCFAASTDVVIPSTTLLSLHNCYSLVSASLHTYNAEKWSQPSNQFHPIIIHTTHTTVLILLREWHDQLWTILFTKI